MCYELGLELKTARQLISDCSFETCQYLRSQVPNQRNREGLDIDIAMIDSRQLQLQTNKKR